MRTNPDQQFSAATGTGDASPDPVPEEDAPSAAGGDPASVLTEMTVSLPEDAQDGLDEARAGLLAGGPPDLAGSLLLVKDGSRALWAFAKGACPGGYGLVPLGGRNARRHEAASLAASQQGWLPAFVGSVRQLASRSRLGARVLRFDPRAAVVTFKRVIFPSGIDVPGDILETAELNEFLAAHPRPAAQLEGLEFGRVAVAWANARALSARRSSENSYRVSRHKQGARRARARVCFTKLSHSSTLHSAPLTLASVLPDEGKPPSGAHGRRDR